VCSSDLDESPVCDGSDTLDEAPVSDASDTLDESPVSDASDTFDESSIQNAEPSVPPSAQTTPEGTHNHRSSRTSSKEKPVSRAPRAPAAEQLMEQPIETPIEQPIEQPIKQPIEQPIEQSIEQQIEQPIAQPTAPAFSSTLRVSQAPAEPAATPLSAPEPPAELKEYCTVAVCAGRGIEAVFRDLGVDRIITGGQTMNPSTEDILEKINDAPSDVVFVLPNNRNIIMAAQQCIPLTDKQVFVIPTKSIPQGIAAMLSIDEADDINEISSCMASAARRVRTALVTKAARDSFFDGRQIMKGEYLALFEDSLAANGPDAYAVIDTIATALCSFSPEFITIFSGEGVGEADAAAVANRIGSFSPNAETSVIKGDQPIYHFIISAE
jgi:hypothetical protein